MMTMSELLAVLAVLEPFWKEAQTPGYSATVKLTDGTGEKLAWTGRLQGYSEILTFDDIRRVAALYERLRTAANASPTEATPNAGVYCAGYPWKTHVNTFGIWWHAIGGVVEMSGQIDIEADNAKEAFLKLYDDGGFWYPFKTEWPRWIPYAAIIEVAGPVGTANVKPKSRKGTPEVKKK